MQQEEKRKDRFTGPWVLAQDNGEQVLKLHPLHLRDTRGTESQGLDGIGGAVGISSPCSRREGTVLCDQSAFSCLWLADVKFGAVERTVQQKKCTEFLQTGSWQSGSESTPRGL